MPSAEDEWSLTHWIAKEVSRPSLLMLVYHMSNSSGLKYVE